MRSISVVSAQLARSGYGIPLRAQQVGQKLKVSTTSRRGLSCTAARGVDFTHAVIGAGAVGLAVARQLAQREGTSTILLERHGAVGTETSSRNSEVIHAGLYYGRDSLKKELCIRGKEMIYALCDEHAIPYKKTGKWIVAQTDEQWERLVQLHEFSRTINVPTHFISPSDAARLEPSVRAQAGVLASPTTGILDSHAYMQYLLGAYLDTSRGDIAYHTTVTSITPLGTPPDHMSGYAITTRDTNSPSGEEDSTITATTLTNASGLSACTISNLLLPPSRHTTPYYAKGNYFAYSSSAPHPLPTRLIYPAPEPGLGGLGTHLTLDLAGAIRFGPDVEWVDSPDDLSVSETRLPAALGEIRKYLPGLREEALRADYAGVRPKIARGGAVADGGKAKGGSDGAFVDFVIREEQGFKGFVNLLGIESPGLTSSLAIAEMVEGILYR